MHALARPNLKLITFIVVACHLLLIFYAHLFFHTTVFTPPKREKMLVKTIKLSPPKTSGAPVSAPAPLPVIEEAPPIIEPEPLPSIEPEPAIPPKEEVSSPPQEIETTKETPAPPKPAAKPIVKPKPKPAAIKKPAPKPVPKKKELAPVKKEAPAKPKETPKKTIKKDPVPEAPKVDPQAEALKQKKRALLDQARSVASKVDTNASRLKSGSSLENIAIPSQLGELKIDNLAISTEESLNVRERGYRDELASRLKLMLKLPEFGVVKLKLTLNRLGKVIDVTITQSESSSNKTHVKKTLPTITFPAFGDNFSGHETFTFQITLNSE